MYHGIHMTVRGHLGRDGSLYSLSSMWVRGIEFRSSGGMQVEELVPTVGRWLYPLPSKTVILTGDLFFVGCFVFIGLTSTCLED